MLDTIKVNKKYKPITLLIMDGWGLSPAWGGNAINMANPVNFNNFWRQYPHTMLQAFKPIKGNRNILANSEIGHTTIGTGRIVEQDIEDINEAIKTRVFFDNYSLKKAFSNTIEHKSNLHLIGLLSDGLVHSHINHLFALLDMAKLEKVKNVFIHIITDGKDVAPNSAIEYFTKLKEKITSLGIGKIASVVGRYYAMDKANNWDRTLLAYNAEALGLGRQESDYLKFISKIYLEGINDEFIPPTTITENSKQAVKINKNDSIIFFNTRADRMQQLVRSYGDSKSYRTLFGRKIPFNELFIVTLTDYNLKLDNVNVAFKQAKIINNLSNIISENGYNQLHIAESEKASHITYYFNGGRDEPYLNEDRIIVPSLTNNTADNTPEMKTEIITEKVNKAIKSNKYDFIVTNFANVDTVAHTGNIIATTKAVISVDKAIKSIVDTSLENNGLVIITSDHGNAEQMINQENNNLENYHSSNPVPFILIARDLKSNLFKSAYSEQKLMLSEIVSSKHTLADIAPTILELMNISKPIDMTGKSLLKEI